MKGAQRESLLGAIGAVVRESREARDLSRRELALQASLSERFLADLEGGEGNISVSRLDKLAHALGTTAAGLLLFCLDHFIFAKQGVNGFSFDQG